MTPLPLFHPGRIARLATLFTFLACATVRADGVPPPDPPPPPAPSDSLGDSLLYIRDITVGRSPCATCPPQVCPEEPTLVTVRGQFPNACYTLRSLHVAANRGLFTVVVADVVVNACEGACALQPVGFEASTEIPSAPPGPHVFVLREQGRICPDTTVVSSDLGRPVPYTVLSRCGAEPVPTDSLVRTFVSLRIVPEHPCAGGPVTLELVKNGCPPCVHLVSFGPSPDDSLIVGVVDWTPLCAELHCAPETLSTPLGQLSAGSFTVNVPITVRVLGTENPDSTIAFVSTLHFEVGPPCGGPPARCVAREMFSNVPAFQCAVTLASGASGTVPLLYESDLEMAAAQGTIELQAPFQLMNLALASQLTGVHFSWTRDGRGARWLVFTDPGVTLAPGARQHLLDATVRPDFGARPGASSLMFAHITLASSAAGRELPLCDRRALDLQVIATRLCVAGDPSVCDVNHDGQLDVRDLVHMVGCLRRLTDADTGACVDCNGSGAFDFSDIFCCAREILRGPGVPRDSVRVDASLHVSLGPVYTLGEDRLVHVRVTGARALGATSLRFDYPAERWRADSRVLPLLMEPRPMAVDAGWTPLVDFDDPGHVYLGALRLGDSGGEDTFEFEVLMHPIASPLPGDRLEGAGAEFGALDGTVITPSGALPSLSLTAPAPPEPSPFAGPLALSPARPNPFNTSTSFVVTLPSSAHVDLAVHDLAGRRVATLAHGAYSGGRQLFTWDGAGAHDGVYFVQLTVDGQIRSTRVALLRNTH